MEQVNGVALLNLASSKISQEIEALGGETPGGTAVQASLLRQAQEQHQRNVDAAALEILKLKRNKQEFLANLATQNVAAQAVIDNNKALAAKANRADAYGDSSDNYLPLQKVLSGTTASGDKALNEVPADFSVAPAAPAAAAA